MNRNPIMFADIEGVSFGAATRGPLSLFTVQLFLMVIIAVYNASCARLPAANATATSHHTGHQAQAGRSETVYNDDQLEELRDDAVRRLYARGVTDAAMPGVARFRDLEVLDVADTDVTDRGLVGLGSLRHLQSVNLFETAVTDQVVDLLAELPCLTQLDLGRTRVTGAKLSTLTRLRQLQLSGAEGINDVAMGGVASLRRLELLDVKGTNITDKGLELISSMGCLTDLRVASDRITDEGIRHVGSLWGIQRLDLSGTMITDKGLAPLQDMAALTDLDLSGDAITDRGLRSFIGLPRLKRIWLRSTFVTAAGLSELRRAMPRLEVNPITDWYTK